MAGPALPSRRAAGGTGGCTGGRTGPQRLQTRGRAPPARSAPLPPGARSLREPLRAKEPGSGNRPANCGRGEELPGRSQGASVAGNSPEPASFLSRVDRISNNGHISEERSKEPYLFDRAVSEQLTTVDQGTVTPETQNRAPPCSQLLSFLQRNIVIAAISVAGILVATGLLLLMLTIYSRRKRPLAASPSDWEL
ncbi:uncharacterized protein C2orf92 homolog [Hipposideros larvatus]